MNAREYLESRGSTRLCHFTRFQNLPHILASEKGILASNMLKDEWKVVNDKERYDGATDHVCCSIEYPNVKFLYSAKKRNPDPIFDEWVIICISLDILDNRELKFSPSNAAKGCGRHIFDDENQINKLFNTTVFEVTRKLNLLECCPTDIQAEILVKNNIPKEYICGIIVSNKDMANRVTAVIKSKQLDIPVYICEEIETYKVIDIIENNIRPQENLYNQKE